MRIWMLVLVGLIVLGVVILTCRAAKRGMAESDDHWLDPSWQDQRENRVGFRHWDW